MGGAERHCPTIIQDTFELFVRVCHSYGKWFLCPWTKYFMIGLNRMAIASGVTAG
jgi:hypothetical protein